MVRVLIADDSELIRTVLGDLLAGDPGIEVVAAVGDGRQALAATCRLRPDLVLMDILMPEMDGLTAVSAIMACCPTPILVLSGNLHPEENRYAFEAIQRGALDVMAKPTGDDFAAFAAQLRTEIRFLARIRVLHHFRPKTALRPQLPAVTPPGGRDLLAIGASTGGPRAVLRLMKALDPRSGARVLIVQHIAAGFAADFADWLDGASRFRVRLAAPGQRLEPGLALVAPDDKHLCVDGERVLLSDAPPVNSCRPAVDVLFASLAETQARRTVAVLLTGMGQDGAAGMLELRRRGAYTIAQDRASSAIFGMPKAAIARGAVDKVLDLDAIPELLGELLGG